MEAACRELFEETDIYVASEKFVTNSLHPFNNCFAEGEP